MTVQLVSRADSRMPLGGIWEIRWDLCGDGLPADPVVAVTVTLPSGVAVDPAPVPVYSGGVYAVRVTLPDPGRYVARVTGDAGVVEAVAWVDPPVYGNDMPTFDDLADYMGETSWTADEMTDALTAEAAAQRGRCRIPAAYPADLRSALLRRAQRALAMRRLPLAMPTGDPDIGPQILPGNDPEVRRLEAPHRKVVFG